MNLFNLKLKLVLATLIFFLTCGVIAAQSACNGPLTITVSPVQPAGGYLPGTQVDICVSMNGYTQSFASWFHGMGFDFGQGWDLSTINPYGPAASCDGLGVWQWFPSCTSSSSGIQFGPGFYYDSVSGPGTIDGIPGNNYGDDCSSNIWTFCLTIKTDSLASAAIPLTGFITITGDGNSGVWGSNGCPVSYYTFNSLLGLTPCSASFSVAAPLLTNTQILVLNNSTGVMPSYSWVSGSGDSSALQSPGFVYDSAATYQLCLNIIDLTGCTDSLCVPITIAPNYFQNSGSCSINGTVFYDINSNKVWDLYEPGMQGIGINIQPSNLTSQSGIAGNFSLIATPGSYHIEPLIPPGWTLTTDSASYNGTVSGSLTSLSGFNFGLIPNQFTYQAQLGFYEGPSVCNSSVMQQVSQKNTGQNFFDGLIKYIKADSVTIQSMNPMPDSVVADTYYWNYYNLPPTHTKYITLQVQKPVTIGYQFEEIVDSEVRNSLGSTVIHDADTTYETVTCSFDPNQKIVNPVSNVNGQNYTLIGQSLEYTIDFQNTGTAVAQNILISDTLSPNLEISTFRLISSSHPVTILFGANNTLNMAFYNINLPDSNSDEPGSHGYIKFMIDPITNIVNNTPISNFASIYFDSNSPVQTSTANTIMVNALPVGLLEQPIYRAELKVFPNPNSGDCIVQYGLSSEQTRVMEIIDCKGAVVKTQVLEMGSSQLGLHLKDMKKGLYLFMIRGSERILTQKVLITD